MKYRMLLTSVLFCSFVQAQQRSVLPLAFEVASIKPTQSSGGGVSGGCRGIDSKFAPNDPRVNVPLGRCVITAGRLSHLMGIAFQMSLQRISGFPDWDGPSRFDLEAKADDPTTATEQQLLSMLQNLLSERFKLALRHITTELPVFALLVGKNGPKLHASELDARSPVPEVKGSALVLKGYSLADLADFLSNLPSIGRPVHDMTGINGRFDFTFNLLESQPESIGDLKMAIATWQNAVNDVQGPLGLTLESQKGSIDSLVIDHAEKPTSN